MDTCAGLWREPGYSPSFVFRPRTTKLYTCLLTLLVFTSFTFAADRTVHPEDWLLINDHQSSKAEHDTRDCDPDDDMCFDGVPIEHVKAASDSFDAHGNETLAHEHEIAIGIAQDLFFDVNEENWENARPYDLLTEWSQDPNIFEQYQLEKQSRPDLTIISYLPESLIGWTGMRCDVDFADGCRNMPTQDDILAHYPQRRHKARQLKFSLLAIQRYYIQGHTLIKVLQAAKTRLDGHCEEFTRIFFHDATHHKGHMCAEQVINIVMQVILAIVAVTLIATTLIGIVVEQTVAAAAEAFGVLGNSMVAEVSPLGESVVEVAFEVGEAVPMTVAVESADAAEAAEAIFVAAMEAQDYALADEMANIIAEAEALAEHPFSHAGQVLGEGPGFGGSEAGGSGVGGSGAGGSGAGGSGAGGSGAGGSGVGDPGIGSSGMGGSGAGGSTNNIAGNVLGEGPSVKNLANTVADSAVAITRNSAARLSRPVLPTAEDATEGGIQTAEEIPPWFTETVAGPSRINPARMRPPSLGDVAEEQDSERVANMDPDDPGTHAVMERLYHQLAEQFLGLPAGTLDRVDLEQTVGLATLNDMVSAYFFDNIPAMVQAVNALRDTALPYINRQSLRPIEEEEESESVPNLDGTGESPSGDGSPPPNQVSSEGETSAPNEVSPPGEGAPSNAPEDANPPPESIPGEGSSSGHPGGSGQPEGSNRPEDTNRPPENTPEESSPPGHPEGSNRPEDTSHPPESAPGEGSPSGPPEGSDRPEAPGRPEDVNHQPETTPEENSPSGHPEGSGRPEDANHQPESTPEENSPSGHPEGSNRPEVPDRPEDPNHSEASDPFADFDWSYEEDPNHPGPPDPFGDFDWMYDEGPDASEASAPYGDYDWMFDEPEYVPARPDNSVPFGDYNWIFNENPDDSDSSVAIGDFDDWLYDSDPHYSFGSSFRDFDLLRVEEPNPFFESRWPDGPIRIPDFFNPRNGWWEYFEPSVPLLPAPWYQQPAYFERHLFEERAWGIAVDIYPDENFWFAIRPDSGGSHFLREDQWIEIELWKYRGKVYTLGAMTRTKEQGPFTRRAVKLYLSFVFECLTGVQGGMWSHLVMSPFWQEWLTPQVRMDILKGHLPKKVRKHVMWSTWPLEALEEFLFWSLPDVRIPRTPYGLQLESMPPNPRQMVSRIWNRIQRVLHLNKPWYPKKRPRKKIPSYVPPRLKVPPPSKRNALPPSAPVEVKAQSSQSNPRIRLWSMGGVFREGQYDSITTPNAMGFVKSPSERLPWKRMSALPFQEDIDSSHTTNNSQPGQLHLGSSLHGGELSAGLLTNMALEHEKVLGVFSRMESFAMEDLIQAPADETSLYSQVFINSTSFFATDAAQAVADQIRSGNHDLTGDQVVRSTIEFLLVERSVTQETSKRSENLPDYLGSRIARRLQHMDGTPMDSLEARDFLYQYSSTINAHRDNLRRHDLDFEDTSVKLPPETPSSPNFLVVPGPGETSWLNILGGVELVGVRSSRSLDKGTTELQLRANKPLVAHSSQTVNRSTGDPERPVADPLIVHHLAAMRGMTHARFLGGARWGANQSTTPSITRDGDIYRVQLRKEYFRNEIKGKGECSIDNYTGDQAENLKNCHGFLDDAVDPVVRKLGYSISEMDNEEDWEPQGMAPFVHYLTEQFPSYETIKRTNRLWSQHRRIEDKLFERLKNSLVAKAWADESCFVKCSPASQQGYHKREELHSVQDDVCRAVCYDKTEQRAEGLYGLDSMTNLGAEMPPWNLNKTNILEVSHAAYMQHGAGSILPGSVNLNPYDVVYEDVAPPLPVCRSELATISPSNEYHKGAATYPCTCGDKYGNETMAFMNAAPAGWRGHGHKQESRMLETCIKDERLGTLAETAPAAYLNNMCQIVYGAISPPGVGSWMELKYSAYTENENMCRYVTDFVADNKDKGDKYLDTGVCKIWASQADDFHRNSDINIGMLFVFWFSALWTGKHKVDFSDINSKLNHGACHWARDWWHDACDKGKNWRSGECDMPCPNYGFGDCSS